MAPARRPAETSSNISRAFTIPAASIRPWATSAQLSLSVWRPNPVHFFGGRSRGTRERASAGSLGWRGGPSCRRRISEDQSPLSTLPNVRLSLVSKLTVCGLATSRRVQQVFRARILLDEADYPEARKHPVSAPPGTRAHLSAARFLRYRLETILCPFSDPLPLPECPDR
jgi:hypothetical protein